MVVVNANCDNDMLNDVDVIESLSVKEWCRGCGPRSRFLTSGQEAACRSRLPVPRSEGAAGTVGLQIRCGIGK